MKKFIIYIVISGLFLGCDDKRECCGLGASENFVNAYIIPDGFESYASSETKSISVRLKGKYEENRGNGSKSFTRLADRYRDWGYTGNLFPGQNTASAIEFDGITVVCDTDIDENHQAGSSLDDIILMLGFTFSEYINSGYTSYTKDVDQNYGIKFWQRDWGYSPFIKYLNDITKKDLVLLSRQFELYPPRDWPKGHYNLTVTLYGEDTEVSGTVTYVVE